jgi:hypothetical protein
MASLGARASVAILDKPGNDVAHVDPEVIVRQDLIYLSSASVTNS